MQILIVDDNAGMRAAIREILRPITADIGECADGASAVEIYQRLRPHWVLLDICLIGVNGLEAARRIRAFDPDSRIIVMTAIDGQQFRRAASEIGAFAYLRKEDLLSLPDVLTTRSRS